MNLYADETQTPKYPSFAPRSLQPPLPPNSGPGLVQCYYDVHCEPRDGTWFDKYIWWGDAIDSIKDLVDKAFNLSVTRDQRFLALLISGEGGPGHQCCGGGKDNASGLKTLQLAPGRVVNHKMQWVLDGGAEETLSKLRGRFLPNAVVSLIGCEIVEPDNPQNGFGLILLKRISAALGGVKVQGGDQLQRAFPPGMEGNVWRCDPNDCSIVSASGHSWWGVPD